MTLGQQLIFPLSLSIYTNPTSTTFFQMIIATANMKKQSAQVFGNFLLFALLLLLSYSISARPLAREQYQAKKVVKPDVFGHVTAFKGIQEDLVNLMGLVKCDENDEECMKRRMIAEAHLDYIYTQHHNP